MNIEQNFDSVKYNKITISYRDISTFNVSKRSENDKYNKLRENIVGCIINNKIPENYYNFSPEWLELKNEINNYIKFLARNNDISNINDIKCIHKAGRRHHYDFNLIINNTNIFNVEFKFNCESVNDTAQFISPMKPSQYLEDNYEEYYYDNYLVEHLKNNNFPIIPKELYLEKIHQPHPKCTESIQTKYYNGCKHSSKYTSKVDDIEFYNNFNKISKKSISEFITKYNIKKDLLSDYLLETQKNKIYMLYKDGKIYFQTINLDDYIITNVIKQPEKYRYICETKSNIKLKILLRWKNGNGIAYPAFQIS